MIILKVLYANSVINLKFICLLRNGSCGLRNKLRVSVNESVFVVLFRSFSKYQERIQINQPTRCNSFTSLLLDVYVWLNMFRAPPRPSSGAYNCTMSLWFYRWREAVGALLVVVWQTTTNNAATATLQR